MAYIDDIDPASPNDDPDQVAGGAAQFRQLKTDVLGSFPSLGLAAVTRTAAELNAAISADSTDTLTNKTIDTATFQGTQTGFVGDVDGDITGNAATVTTNADMTGDVTSIGNATTIANNAVKYDQIGTNAVTYEKHMANNLADVTLSSSAAGVAIPHGVYNIGDSTTTIAATDVFLEINIGGVWVPTKTINHTAGGNVELREQITGDNISVRIRCADNLVFNARRIYD